MRRTKSAPPSRKPAVSVLKPVRGRDPEFYSAIRSHAVQRYPEFEILFGVADPADPALEDIARLRREFPSVPIRVLATASDAPNRKAGSLEFLAREARHDVMLVNDGDITVEPDYLERVVSRLEDERVGLVTCLFRGRGISPAARAEALGLVTEFMPSVLVFFLLDKTGVALGATMAFRRRELEAIGGFAAIREYLADDYQLGAHIAATTGKRIGLADSIVETHTGSGSWSEVWRHQVRWSRTVRISRTGGYYGYFVTQVSFWSLLAAISGYWQVAVAGIVVRYLSAWIALRQIGGNGLLWVPVRDLFGFAVWAVGAVGDSIEWRGDRFRLLRDGRMVRVSSQAPVGSG